MTGGAIIGRRLVLAAGLAAGLGGAARATDAGSRWIGCAVKAGIYDLGQVDGFAQAIGRPPDVLLFFQGFATSWNANRVAAIAARGLRPMVTLTCGPQESLGDLLAGRYDAAISAAARFSRAAPPLVRVMHEMNGSWTSYGRQPAAFIAGWKHVHALWRAAGNPAPFVWSPNITGNGNTDPDLAAYYPGDDVCDIVGLDGYRSRYQTAPFEALFGRDIEALGRVTGKPLVIAEVGADPRIPGVDVWIAEMFRALERMPRVQGLTWWDRDEYALQPGAMTEAFAEGVRRWSRPA